MKPSKSVFFLYMGQTREPGACEIYRGNLPAYYLGLNGWITGWGFLEDIFRQYQKEGLKVLLQLISNFKIFVFPRLFISNDHYEESKEALRFLYELIRGTGNIIVYETDDDYTNRDRQVVDGDAITPVEWADYLTVSTKKLGEIMSAYISPKKTYVLPNCLDPGLWKAPLEEKKDDSKIVIGLTGSSTHERDWEVLAEVMPKILEENKNAHFLLGGYHPKYFDNLPNTTRLPGVKYNIYSQVVKKCDIVLAPVNDEPFNDGKSAIKVIEGMAATRRLQDKLVGAACIASNHIIYRSSIKHAETGLLVQHTPQDWYHAITKMVQDHVFRHRIQASAYKWVYANHDISTQWRKWHDAYIDMQKQ